MSERGVLARLIGSFDTNGERNKFRARIERTARNTAEITITDRGFEEVITSPLRDTTKWQARPADPQLEAILLQRIALRFAPLQAVAVAAAPAPAPAAAPAVAAAPAPAAPVAVPAAAVVEARVHKVNVGGFETLQLEDDLETSLRRVGIALDRDGFTIEDRSREQHRYAVRYLDPDYEASEREKRSWWDQPVQCRRQDPGAGVQDRPVAANGPRHRHRGAGQGWAPRQRRDRRAHPRPAHGTAALSGRAARAAAGAKKKGRQLPAPFLIARAGRLLLGVLRSIGGRGSSSRRGGSAAGAGAGAAAGAGAGGGGGAGLSQAASAATDRVAAMSNFFTIYSLLIDMECKLERKASRPLEINPATAIA